MMESIIFIESVQECIIEINFYHIKVWYLRKIYQNTHLMVNVTKIWEKIMVMRYQGFWRFFKVIGLFENP
jgi:hypothetical protein